MVRSFRRRVLASVAVAVLAAGCSRQPPAESSAASQVAVAPAPPAPTTARDTPVTADAQALATFEQRVKEYVALHKTLEDTLPKLEKESTPEKIDAHQRALGKLVQDARKGAKPGDIFTPEAQVVVKRVLAKVFAGDEGRQVKASIMDENPTSVRLAVNGRYPDTVPLSTVPPQVLASLPKLPDELEFRFIGHRLILLDVGAHIVIDFVENALP